MWRRILDSELVIILLVYGGLFGGGLLLVHLLGWNPMYFVVGFLAAAAVTGISQ